MDENAAAWVDYYRRIPPNALAYSEPSPALLEVLERQDLWAADQTFCLDLGAGSGGRMGNSITAHGFIPLILDVSLVALRDLNSSERRPASPVLSRIAADARRLPISSASIALVVASDLFMHLSRWAGYLSEICRVLKPGGMLAFNWLGEKDCQKARATKVTGGYMLPNGVPIRFRGYRSAAQMLSRCVCLQPRAFSHVSRLDPPHPEFHPEWHVHDEWAVLCERL